MEKEVNPYAVTLGEEGVARSGDGEPEPLATPIRFQGRLALKQIKLASRQIYYVPMPLHVAFWCFALTVGPLSVFEAISSLQQPSETLPLYWFVIGLLIFTAYWLLPFLRCFYAFGACGRRTRRLIARDAEMRGWMSDTGITVWTPSTAMQCNWEHFTPAVLFPDRIQLADCVDDRLRFILAWQMFESPASFQRARQFFIDRDRFATKPDDPVQQAEKERARLEKMFGDHERSFDFEVEHVNWSPNQFPPDGEEVECTAFTIHLDRLQSRGKKWIDRVTVFAIVVVLLPLPVWMSLGAWLWHDFSFYGDWSFLQFNWLANLSFQIPFVLVVGFWMVMWFNQTRLEKRRSTHPVLLTFSADHMCFQTEHSTVWWKWSEVIEVETSPTSAKFLTVGMVDAVELTPSGFESLADYERFRVLLEQRNVGSDVAPSS